MRRGALAFFFAVLGTAVSVSVTSPLTNGCTWSLLHLSCEPSDKCSYQYEFGDLTPSESCRPKKNSTVQQVHIALGDGISAAGYANSMVVSWVTTANTKSMVIYGTTSGSLSTTVNGADGSSYYESYDHHVELTNLSPGQKYYYRAGDGTTFSEEFSFVVMEEGKENLKVCIVGDMGLANSASTRELLTQVAPDMDLIYHVGDVGYADDAFLHGNPTQFKYEDAFNNYMNSVQSVVSSSPYMTLPGNHEAECHSPACQLDPNRLDKLSNFSAYNHRFKMPSQSSRGVLNMWYSFNAGLAHFISINTETDYPHAPLDEYTLHRANGNFGNQLAWLENDLMAANSPEARKARPWVIIAGHRPVYSINKCNSDGTPKDDSAYLQAAIEELLFKYKVDMYIAGHVHSYERHYPVYQNFVETSYVNPKYPVHVLNGAGGCDENHSSYSKAVDAKWNVVKNDQDWGLSTLQVFNRTHLGWNFVSSSTGATLDEFVLVQEQH